MFDNIDNMEMEMDIHDPDYQKLIRETLTIQAVKETAQKLEKLRKEFYHDDHKLDTVKHVTHEIKETLKHEASHIKEVVKEEAAKIINKNLDKQRAKFQRKKNELLNQLNKKVEQASAYSQTENFMRTLDKFSFVFGVVLFGTFAYLLGSMPNYGFYIFYSLLVPTMIIIRFFNYKKKKWHYFMIDFCYFGTATVWGFINIFPKSAIVYRLAFLYANGALAVATAAFSNALIFHQFDRLICLCTHPVPLIVMWNVTHVTMK